MNDKQLIQMGLGLKEPWFVKGTNLDVRNKKMDIHIDFLKGSRFPCPLCNKDCEIHDTKERTWRHLDFFQHETYLHARVPRIKCEEHGIRQISLPWARAKTGFTLLMEAMIVAMCHEMAVSSVARMARIHEESVWTIVSHYVKEALREMDLSSVDTIGVDEVAVKKGHIYVTIFYDLKGARVIHIELGKGKDVFKRFKDAISDKISPDQIKFISMDMYPSYKGGAKEYFPKARVVYDRFHIIKMMNDALDRIRRRECKTNELLGKTRFIWLKNPDNLSEKDRVRLKSVKDLDTITAKAYQFKLAIQRTWSLGVSDAVTYLKRWYYWASHSGIAEIVRLAKTIKNHFDGIIEAIRSGINNGIVEGLNNKIKTAFKRSYGFKTEKYRNVAIYLVAGKLDLPTRC